MKLYIIIFLGILLFLSKEGYADNFLLPKSFSVNEKSIPKVEEQGVDHSKTQIEIKKGKLDTKTISEAKEVKKLKQHTVINTIKPVNTDLALSDLISNYKYGYLKTLESVMATLAEFNIKPLSYDSSKGQVNAELQDGKQIFIILLPSSEEITHVRITPADGRYDLPDNLVSQLFRNIDRNLYSNVN